MSLFWKGGIPLYWLDTYIYVRYYVLLLLFNMSTFMCQKINFLTVTWKNGSRTTRPVDNSALWAARPVVDNSARKYRTTRSVHTIPLYFGPDSRQWWIFSCRDFYVAKLGFIYLNFFFLFKWSRKITWPYT